MQKGKRKILNGAEEYLSLYHHLDFTEFLRMFEFVSPPKLQRDPILDKRVRFQSTDIGIFKSSRGLTILDS